MSKLHPKTLSEIPTVIEHDLDPCTRLRFRPVRPDDRSRFAMGFTQLSDESRYCRCFASRKELTGKELDMLCNVNGTSHVATVVVSLDEHGQEADSIGGARFIRVDSAPEEAELAFLIVDSWQQRHVGRLLLQHILDVAQTQGIRSLRCYLLPENQKARKLLHRVSQHTGWELTFDQEGAFLDESARHTEPLTCDRHTQSSWSHDCWLIAYLPLVHAGTLLDLNASYLPAAASRAWEFYWSCNLWPAEALISREH